MQKISKYIPFYPAPVYRPPPQTVKIPMPEIAGNMDINPELNTHFKENLPFQEGVILETKQVDIGKILKVIQRKVLKGTHLPVAIKEIEARYLVSPYFKDIYLYLAQNKLLSTKTAIQKVETLAEKYILLDSLLFKIVTTPEKEMALLAKLEVCADKIITLYHSSLFAGHQGVIKIYLTISDKLFILNLIHFLHSYIKGCHICQLACNEKLPTRQLQTRINLNYRPLSRLSMELKIMPRSYKGHKYILHIIMDQDSAFMSSLMNYLFKKLDIK